MKCKSCQSSFAQHDLVNELCLRCIAKELSASLECERVMRQACDKILICPTCGGSGSFKVDCAPCLSGEPEHCVCANVEPELCPQCGGSGNLLKDFPEVAELLSGKAIAATGKETPRTWTREDIMPLVEALDRGFNLIAHANPHAFDNGVKDGSGTVDEGEVVSGRIYEEMQDAINHARQIGLVEDKP